MVQPLPFSGTTFADSRVPPLEVSCLSDHLTTGQLARLERRKGRRRKAKLLQKLRQVCLSSGHLAKDFAVARQLILPPPNIVHMGPRCAASCAAGSGL